MKNKCEDLSLYIIDEMTDHEKEQFNQHLKQCSYCRKELETLQGTWQTLSYDFDEVDVPESLKEDVMSYIFDEEDTAKQNHRPKQPLSLIKNQFSPLSLALAALLFIGLLGMLWNNHQLKNTLTALQSTELNPAQIVTMYQLKGQNIASAANGMAYLVQEGSDTSLVVDLKSMPSTKDEEVYQVWLLKNGDRENAGTLRPDHDGNGLMIYRLPEDLTFDDIGITLEATPHHSQPKGEKVMGTS